MAKKGLSDPDFFGTQKISKILLKTAPPVMLAQLIQALYNIVDSFFVGRYSDEALTALSVIYPIQLIIIALAVGTGVGVNTYMARKFAQGKPRDADEAGGTGMLLELITWLAFTILTVALMKPYVMTSAKSPEAIANAVTYGNIVCIGSVGAFLEGNWTKVLQARGDMRLPMIAQIAGAVINILFDPLLIFGISFFPEMGVAGAAYATVLGQIVAAVITGSKGFCKIPEIKKLSHYIKMIYRYGYPSIFMQLLYTVYIVALNVILAGFSDSAVTVLGLYYKAQSLFFIPLFGLQTCIVPVLSYNYANKSYRRCRDLMNFSCLVSAVFMIVGIVFFVFFPEALMSVFSKSEEVMQIGSVAFPIIGSSFLPAVISLTMPVFFQAIGYGRTSLMLSLTRQVFCLIPIFRIFAEFGLNYTWFAYPISEVISGTIGLIIYFSVLKKWKKETNKALSQKSTTE